MVVLIIDFLMNRLVSSYKHLLFGLIFLGFYIFVAFIGSVIMDRPIYGNNLAFKENYGNNYVYPEELNDTAWVKDERKQCHEFFDKEFKPDY